MLGNIFDPLPSISVVDRRLIYIHCFDKSGHIGQFKSNTQLPFMTAGDLGILMQNPLRCIG